MAGNERKLVLIVDDTPTNVAVVSGVLKDSFRTKVATNGEKALAIAFGPEKPDLILLDVMMPGMDGYEVCRKLKDNPATRKASTSAPSITFTSRSQAPSSLPG
jgi:CheY-like chemotaxis protein